MSLSEAFASEIPSSRRGARCSVKKLLEDLDPEDSATLVKILEDPNWEATRIAKVLQQNNHAMNESPIQRHRRGVCSCEDK